MSDRRGGNALALAAGLLALGSAAGCAGASWNRWSGWTMAKTKNITAYSNMGPSRYTTAVENFELAHAALSSLALFAKTPVAPVEVLILDSNQFVSAFGQFRSGVTIGRLPGQGRLVSGSLVVIDEGHTVHGAAHRITHLMVQAKIPNAPLWVHEGFASYLEGINYMEGKTGAVACFGYAPGGGPMVTLDELFSQSWSEHDVSKKADWYRTTARTLVDYFYTAEGGRLREGWGLLVARATQGGSPIDALAEAFAGATVAQIEKRMNDFRKDSESQARARVECPIPNPIAAEKRADPNDPQIQPLSEQDAEQLMRRVWLVPRRDGYVEWYPPETTSLAYAAAKQKGAELMKQKAKAP